MRTCVVGHVEWVSFIAVDHVPAPGEIVHAASWWAEAGGGGAGAAVQLFKLSGDTIFFTALGNDQVGHRSFERLNELGVRVEAAWRDQPARRAVTHVDREGERTITVLGDRHSPLASDPLPWELLENADATYFTAGDAGALRRARASKVLVATSRVLNVLSEAEVRLDAVVGSELDESERYKAGDIEPPPGMVVRTRGSEGGTFEVAGDPPQTWAAIPVTGPTGDRYGAGDSFAAGLTFGLGRGSSPAEAVRFGARCGAAVIRGNGPYATQLTRDELDLLD